LDVADEHWKEETVHSNLLLVSFQDILMLSWKKCDLWKRFGGDKMLVVVESFTTCGEPVLGDAPPEYATDYREMKEERVCGEINS
jgi:hypothetical protein